MKIYGLIGYPLTHSFSKQYFTEKFKKEGLKNCAFEVFPLSNIDKFPLLLKTRPDIKGICVTIPYKEAILKYVGTMSPEVNFAGAANCIKIKGKELIAYNTDIIGFESSFVKLMQPHDTRALVLGSGGSSKAVQYVLKNLGFEFLIVTRSQNPPEGMIHYKDIDEKIMSDYTVIINCTPLGMSPDEESFPPIPYDLVSSSHYLFDLVYTPEKTQFLQKGEERGAVIKNGLEMLHIQAEENWKVWNG